MTDLHIHTLYSDGEYNEHEIVELIENSQVTEFAITDHDTIIGSMKVAEILKQTNSNIIFHSGVEMTCRIFDYMGGINVHLLYRDFDYDNPVLEKFLIKAQLLRKEKIAATREFVKDTIGIEIPWERLNEFCENIHVFAKPHMYKLICEYANYDRDKYYKIMDKMDTQRFKLDAVEVIEALREYKGYFTLAHPREIMNEYDLNYQDIDNIVSYLVQHGLKGIETKHSKQSELDHIEFSKIAKRYNLIETFGSDYHGPTVKPTVKLGGYR